MKEIWLAIHGIMGAIGGYALIFDFGPKETLAVIATAFGSYLIGLPVGAALGSFVGYRRWKKREALSLRGLPMGPCAGLVAGLILGKLFGSNVPGLNPVTGACFGFLIGLPVPHKIGRPCLPSESAEFALPINPVVFLVGVVGLCYMLLWGFARFVTPPKRQMSPAELRFFNRMPTHAPQQSASAADAVRSQAPRQSELMARIMEARVGFQDVIVGRIQNVSMANEVWVNLEMANGLKGQFRYKKGQFPDFEKLVEENPVYPGLQGRTIKIENPHDTDRKRLSLGGLSPEARAKAAQANSYAFVVITSGPDTRVTVE